MIQIDNLRKKYGARMILKDLNGEILPGDFVSLMGSNGTGKTTLLNILAMIVAPSGGDIIFNGTSVKRDSIGIRRKTGYLSHNSFLYEYLTGIQNLYFYGKLYRVKNLNREAERVLNLVNLFFARNDPVFTYSRGMVQRLAFARCMLHKPDFYLLDEPFSGLDQKSVIGFYSILNSLIEGKCSVIMATHSIEHAESLSHRIWYLQNGEITKESVCRQGCRSESGDRTGLDGSKND